MTATADRPPAAARRPVDIRTLLVMGAIAGPFFTLGWIIEGAIRPDYDPLRHPVSSLELGAFGWAQQVNFVLAGTMTLAFAIGLRRALRPFGGSIWGPLLVAGHAVGLLGAGIFVTDPVNGYPPGTPDHLPAYSGVPAALHDLFSIGTFVGLPIAILVFARRFHRWGERRWAAYSVTTGVAMAISFVLTSLAFNQFGGLVPVGGLLQRITVTIGWAWLTGLAVHLLAPRSATARES